MRSTRRVTATKAGGFDEGTAAVENAVRNKRQKIRAVILFLILCSIKRKLYQGLQASQSESIIEFRLKYVSALLLLPAYDLESNLFISRSLSQNRLRHSVLLISRARFIDWLFVPALVNFVGFKILCLKGLFVICGSARNSNNSEFTQSRRSRREKHVHIARDD